MALKAWNIQIARTDKFFNSLSDEDLLKAIAPGRNRVIYLLGHLIAVNDSMIALFGAGERKYAHFDEAFIRSPDKSGHDVPEVSTLRNDWKVSNKILTDLFNQMSPEEWMSKHTAMTDDDFGKDPGRNKLSVL